MHADKPGDEPTARRRRAREDGGWATLRLALHPSLLGFGALLAATLCYAPTFVSCLRLAGEGSLLDTFALFSLACACACCVACWFGCAWVAAHFDGRGLQALGTACFCVGTLGMLGLSLVDVPVSGQVASACCGCLAGLGAPFVYTGWGRRYALLTLRDALLNISLSMGLASAANYALAVVADWAFCLLLCALLLCGCLLSFVGEGSATGDVEAEYREVSHAGEAGGMSLRTVRSAMEILFAPLFGLLVFGFVGALIDQDLIAALFGSQIIGYLIGVALLLVLLILPLRKPLFPLVYQVLFPALAVLSLLARMLAGEGILPGSTFDVCLHVMFGSVLAFSFASIAGIGHARELPIEGLVAGACGLYCLAALVGTLVRLIARPFGLEVSGVALLAWFAYFALQVLYPAFMNWRSNYAVGGCGEGVARPSIEEELTGRCEGLARAHALTPRETEILQLLGRGHGTTYISQELLISDSTVRTHVKNLYRKLGISSREELISLVDSGGGKVARGKMP